MLLSEKTYWFVLSIAFTVLALLIWLWFIPCGILEYNLAVNLFTSSIFMVLTVVLLSWLLNLREKQEWKSVKTAVFSMISAEIAMLFHYLLKFFDDGTNFLLTLSLTDSGAKLERRRRIAEKIASLKKQESVKFDTLYISQFMQEKEIVKPFTEIRRNLGDAQIKYSKHLSPEITMSLMKVQDLLDLLRLSHELNDNLKNLLPSLGNISKTLSELVPELVPKRDTGQTSKKSEEEYLEKIAPKILLTSINSLIREIETLWELGLEFDYS